jgi:MoxR-like ATPase
MSEQGSSPRVLDHMDHDSARQALLDVRHEVAKAVVGQDATVTGMLIALLSQGHVLLEGVPGVAKTLLVRALSAALSLDTKRVQFTPDLMPGDVTGSLVYDSHTSEFTFREGPVFTNILLADEINRTPPKTQASLLEAMEERQVSVDGVSRPLPAPFLVAATQNPVEYEGTYPLPEAQLDRFLFKLIVDFPGRDAEIGILSKGTRGPVGALRDGLTNVMDRATLQQGHALVDAIRLEDSIVRYIVDLVRATRTDGEVLHGASTRAAAALANAVRARAALEGRDYALPDDVQMLFTPAMRHRIVLGPTAEIEGRTADEVLAAILNRQDAPR